MIKLIVIDLDGTALLNESTLHPYNVEVLKKYIKHGYNVVIATGRPYRSSKKFYKELELDTPIINYNGSYIHDTKPSNFIEKIITVSKEDVIQIETDLKDYICNIMCEYEDDVYIHQNDEWINEFFWQDDIPVRYGLMKDTLDLDPCTFIIEIKDPLKQNEVLEYMKNYPQYTCRFWAGKYNRFAEIYPLGVDKANGIKYVINYLGISKDEVLVIGDAGNDICMIEEFHESCAMINGEEELKKKARYITKLPNTEGGVGYFIEDYFNNRAKKNKN